MKYSGIGGQAVLEGIMMKNRDEYATAVRKPDGEIVIQKETYMSMTEKVKFFSLPFVRGIFSFADSMILDDSRDDFLCVHGHRNFYGSSAFDCRRVSSIHCIGNGDGIFGGMHPDWNFHCLY